MIAIIGCDSIIGSYLLEKFEDKSIGFTRRLNAKRGLFYDLEVGDTTVFNDLKISRAIICAGVTNIEACEKLPEDTYKINCESTSRLVSYFNLRNIPVIGFSSNSIFGVYQSAPNEKNRDFRPTCRYSMQKIITDNFILSLSCKNSVIRLTKVLSLNGIFKEIGYLAKNGGELTLYKNLNFSPISLAYVGQAVKIIIEESKSGLFHLSGNETYSYYGFGQKLAGRFSEQRSSKAIIKPGLSTKQYFHPECAELDMTYTKLSLGIGPQEFDSLCFDVFDNCFSLAD